MRINLIQSSRETKRPSLFTRFAKTWLPTPQAFKWRSFTAGLLTGLLLSLGAAIASANAGDQSSLQDRDRADYEKLKTSLGFGDAGSQPSVEAMDGYLRGIINGNVSRYDTSRIETEYCMMDSPVTPGVKRPRTIDSKNQKQWYAFCEVLYYSRQQVDRIGSNDLRQQIEGRLQSAFGTQYTIAGLIRGHNENRNKISASGAEGGTEIQSVRSEPAEPAQGADDRVVAVDLTGGDSGPRGVNPVVAAAFEPVSGATRDGSEVDGEKEACPTQATASFPTQGYSLTCLRTCGDERIYLVERKERGKITSRVFRAKSNENASLRLAKQAFGLGGLDYRPNHYGDVPGVGLECVTLRTGDSNQVSFATNQDFINRMRSATVCENKAHPFTERTVSPRFSRFRMNKNRFIRGSESVSGELSEEKKSSLFLQCRSLMAPSVSMTFQPPTEEVRRGTPRTGTRVSSVTRRIVPAEVRASVKLGSTQVLECRSQDEQSLYFTEQVLIPSLRACEITEAFESSEQLLKWGKEQNDARRIEAITTEEATQE